MALPTGGIKLSQVNTELGYASNASITLGNATVRTIPHISSGAITMNDLRGKSKITAGVTTITTLGTTDFVLPNYNTLIIELWGAGASGGGGYNNPNGQNGGNTTVTALGLTAGGGGFGYSRNNGGGGGAAGSASGGDLNYVGEAGNIRSYSVPAGGRNGYDRQNGLNGSYSGDPYGTDPGNGGRAGYGNGTGGGGGGGGYVKKTYTYSTYDSPLDIGSTIALFVGTGGAGRTDTSAGEGGKGGNGQIKITVS